MIEVMKNCFKWEVMKRGRIGIDEIRKTMERKEWEKWESETAGPRTRRTSPSNAPQINNANILSTPIC